MRRLTPLLVAALTALLVLGVQPAEAHGFTSVVYADVTSHAADHVTLPDVTATARSLVSLWSLALLIGLVLVIVVAARAVVVLLERRRQRAQDKVEAKVAAAVEES